MNMFNKIKYSLLSLSLNSKLLISYVIIGIICILLQGYMFFIISSNEISKNATNNMQELLKEKNKELDYELYKIEESCIMLNTNHELINELNNINTSNLSSIFRADKNISKIIDYSFINCKNIDTITMLTSYYLFGNNTLHINYKEYENSTMKKLVDKSDDKITWIPTFDLSKMFKQKYLEQIDHIYRYKFSSVMVVDPVSVQDGIFKKLNDNIERPILIVNFSDYIFQKYLGDIIMYPDSFFIVLDDTGNIISKSKDKNITPNEVNYLLNKVNNKKFGSEIINFNNRSMILCYKQSEVTGWISAVLISQDHLLASITSDFKTNLYYICLFMVLLSIVFALFVSKTITRPIKKLLWAITKTGQGNFNVQLSVHSNDEIGFLINKFNEMNKRIKNLIADNYESKLRQKEAEIKALNKQINPHFLYNTLNSINWLAIENNEKEISKMLMDLSNILQYSSKNMKDLETIENEIDFVVRYLNIMKVRFGDRFVVRYEIDKSISNIYVPKFFLQPIVENAILHGFSQINSGGILIISGYREDADIVFEIADNGKGVDNIVLKKIQESNIKSTGIKNIDKRIKLLFGNDYGVSIESKENKGFKATIKIPLIKYTK